VYSASDSLTTVQIEVAGPQDAPDQLPSISTDYSHSLDVSGPGNATARCNQVEGCMYALETLLQLTGGGGGGGGGGSSSSNGSLPSTFISVKDAPDYAWRGFMIDSGRRFVPMDALRDLLDVMAANKLNVLHLHAR
jgi:hexosaminidase